MSKQMDFPELEGKVLTMHAVPLDTDGSLTGWPPETFDVLVAGCCFDVGITLVGAEHKREEFCLNHKNMVMKDDSWWDLEKYTRAFDYVVDQIKAGHLDYDEYVSVCETGLNKCGGMECAFK
jgi:hypothetical protein